MNNKLFLTKSLNIPKYFNLSFKIQASNLINRRLLSNISQVGSSNYSYTYPKSLLGLPETRITRLSNGLRIATESNPKLKTATVGVWIDAGSRFETLGDNGTAHFLEHMSFKGTNKRTQKDIELLIENIGSNLNAYTSREQTVYYAKTLTKNIATSIEILSDILQNSKFEYSAITRERDVILREYEEVQKMKDEVVFDELHKIAFPQSSLGYTILGPTENIKNITRDNIKSYISTNYTADRMVIIGAGGVDHDELVELAKKYFANVPQPTNNKEIYDKFKNAKFVGGTALIKNEYPTNHIVLSVEGVGWSNPDYWSLLVAQSIIGSWDRTLGAGDQVGSKLAKEISKNSLANSFMSFNTSYTDTGLFGVYFITEPSSNLYGACKAIINEWMRLCDEDNISEEEVSRAKNQLKTSLLLSLDGTTPIAEEIGRQMLIFNKRMSPLEVDHLIGQVDKKKIAEVSRKYFINKELAVVGYGQVNQLDKQAHKKLADLMKSKRCAVN
ncbi:hypothetical protein BCR36DRAFT_580204 [Piromyces finnis]|uniref:mitochondrial processing peptidase n=1 Tax=Piromyces finnis TaxID=1754191 RepID=A0A1Y1VKJ7_9FUNG|nr:hypothetical protein BCR36DRAFT_580204 [Piromyces finnis]|eukprot:ORX58604.1 hypothetical protein BCR36DRAFT_580204 [Piromyces finnis]